MGLSYYFDGLLKAQLKSAEDDVDVKSKKNYSQAQVAPRLDIPIKDPRCHLCAKGIANLDPVFTCHKFCHK